MTCIVGIKHDDGVILASDRAMGDDDFIMSISTPKVRQNGLYVIGYAGAIGTGQLVQYITLPTPPKNNIEKFMKTTFCTAIRKAFIESGVDMKENGDADLLVGVGSSLFYISPLDYQVVPYDYVSIGTGAPIAMGSLYTTATWKSPYKRAYTAVAAAIELSPTCRGPIDVIEI